MALNEIKMSMSLATAGVTKALGKAKTGISNFATSANQKLGSVAKLVSGGLALAFVGFAKKAIDLGSELSDIATSTGFATEQFQVFRGALIDAGGKAGAMEKSIINMQKAVIQGSEGLTTYTRAFERLGLNVKDLKALSPEQQFEEIGKAIAGAGDKQEAFTSALEIFGTKNAPRLMEVFQRLAKDGYGKMATDVEEAYGIMDEATQKSLDKAADAVERFKVKATIKVGDLISGEANFAALKALGARFGAMMAQVGEWLGNAFLGAVKHLGAGMAAAVGVVTSNLMKGFELAGLTLKKVVAPVINSLVEGLNKLGFDLVGINIGRVQAEIDAIHFKNPATEWKELNKDMLDGMVDVKISTKPAQDALNDLADTYDSMAKTSGVVAASQKERAENADAEAMKAIIAAKATEEQAAAEALVAEEVRLQAELKEAIARGDLEAVKVTEDALKIEKEIQKVMKDSGVTRDQATKHVMALRGEEQKLANEKNAQTEKEEAAAAKEEAQAAKMLGMERDLLDAVLSGDEMAARAAQKKIDLEQRAQQIMQDLKVDYQEAYEIAKKLAAIEAGPDLNDSGFVTRFEQKEFDRQQKERQKILDKGLADEERDQRERGGNIRNVSDEKRDRGTVRERAAAAKELREQRKANQRINRERDPEERKAMIEAEDKRRADVQEALKPKVGAPPPNGIPGGQPLGPDGRPVDANGNPVPGGGGGGGGGPVEPKQPENAVVAGLGPKLDTQITLLGEIKTALKC